MRKSSGLTCLLVVGLVGLAVTSAQAGCQLKAGQGTGSNDESAKFQAWEAVLQATDWGSWSSFMASGMRIGHAPGYKVANLKHRCGAGGTLGRSCTMHAQLCN